MQKQLTLGKKIGMTRVYHKGEATPVTVISLRETKVLRHDDATAVISIAANGSKTRTLETAISSPEQVSGQYFRPDFLAAGALVDVIGITKGHGFTGVMQRHGFSGLGAAHGVKKVHRSGGSVGQNTEPGRVHPGTKMAGRHGTSRVTIRNLKIVSVDLDAGVVAIEGAVPGHRNAIVTIRHAASART